MPVNYLSHRVITGSFHKLNINPTSTLKSENKPYSVLPYFMSTFKTFVYLLLVVIGLSIFVRMCGYGLLFIMILVLCEFVAKIILITMISLWVRLLMLTQSHVFSVRAFYFTFGSLIFVMFVPGFSNLVYIFCVNSLLLQLSGDIHPNSGPENIELSFMFSNIRSISADNGIRFDCLQHQILDSGAKIIALCEVGNITDSLDNFKINDFNIAFYSKENQ